MNDQPAPYEPPKITYVGNLKDLLAWVPCCHFHEEDWPAEPAQLPVAPDK